MLLKLPEIHAAFPEYFSCFSEDFMREQEALRDEFDAIVEEGVRLAGWNVEDFAEFKHSLPPRIR